MLAESCPIARMSLHEDAARASPGLPAIARLGCDRLLGNSARSEESGASVPQCESCDFCGVLMRSLVPVRPPLTAENERISKEDVAAC